MIDEILAILQLFKVEVPLFIWDQPFRDVIEGIALPRLTKHMTKNLFSDRFLYVILTAYSS